ncbi:DnaJ protein -like protein 2 [Capsicum annuum]|uniref:DnaJ protein -like protein 2 n=1 Tax=Capsicum annuum TaxID=4072 RepID=A0A2G2YSI7_CAPAN|nr:DnaJ protein -like protein 2 [Capsicum annuum]PHT72635.1 DnaJ protein -like protein 2 [Capsicum annuum]
MMEAPLVVVEAAEAEDKEEERMLSTLSRSLWRIFTMGHQRSFRNLAMCCAQSARLQSPSQHPCNECKGTGETISDKDRCPQCKGEKVMQEKKVLEVHVEKGMQNGQKKEHPKFKRKGDDLFIEHTLTLTEALCGFQFVLTHLDNRQLLIKSQPGKVVKPDQFKAINDEGMLLYQRPFMRGKLYVHFTVDFPDSLTPEQCKNL